MMPAQRVPAPGFHKNPGKYPDQAGETLLTVQFANGCIDEKHSYKARELRWSLTPGGYAWDIGAIKKAT